ncbi:hypothetical protein E0198_000735 [Clavispora lusitaniae]|nr:hypothetical protein E0198_000735 [Clavispora lusitaniae]
MARKLCFSRWACIYGIDRRIAASPHPETQQHSASCLSPAGAIFARRGSSRVYAIGSIFFFLLFSFSLSVFAMSSCCHGLYIRRFSLVCILLCGRMSHCDTDASRCI